MLKWTLSQRTTSGLELTVTIFVLQVSAGLQPGLELASGVSCWTAWFGTGVRRQAPAGGLPGLELVAARNTYSLTTASLLVQLRLLL